MKTPTRNDHGEGLKHNRQRCIDPYLFDLMLIEINFLCRKLAKHILKNATIFEIGCLTIRVDTRQQFNCLASSIGKGKDRLDRHAGSYPIGKTGQTDLFIAGKAQGFTANTGWELQWQNPHTDQIRPVNPLKALNNNRLDSK